MRRYGHTYTYIDKRERERERASKGIRKTTTCDGRKTPQPSLEHVLLERFETTVCDPFAAFLFVSLSKYKARGNNITPHVEVQVEVKTHTHTHTHTSVSSRTFRSDIDDIQRTFQSSNNCSAKGTWDPLQKRRERERESNRIRPSQKDRCFFCGRAKNLFESIPPVNMVVVGGSRSGRRRRLVQRHIHGTAPGAQRGLNTNQNKYHWLLFQYIYQPINTTLALEPINTKHVANTW